MKRNIIRILILILISCSLLSSCSPYMKSFSSKEGTWRMGFGSEEIALPEESNQPLYIAGYHAGCEITGVLDLQRANAVWVDTGSNGILLIGIDCVGLGKDTVDTIRKELASFCRKVGCISVNVYATHSHAGADTLGLWGPTAIDGKNQAFMTNLINAAVSAAKEAYADRCAGTLHYGNTVPEDMLHDSRLPIEYDPILHQLRFIPSDESKNGIRLLSYAAHAESLRGDNTMLSRDFPGTLADNLLQACGDDMLYLPSAIGGLIMTRELVTPFDAVTNMQYTAERITESVLSICDETELSPNLSFSSVSMQVPLDNTLFFYYKFLGILGNETSRGKSDTGYVIHSELSVLTLGSVTFALIPGEIFPELVSGQGLSDGDPEALEHIAARYGVERLLIVGLCNDELGYIMPPSDFLLNDELPYIETVTDDMGENHYEETNSTGRETAARIAKAFETALKKQKELNS